MASSACADVVSVERPLDVATSVHALNMVRFHGSTIGQEEEREHLESHSMGL
jgi:hypothetical protein